MVDDTCDFIPQGAPAECSLPPPPSPLPDTVPDATDTVFVKYYGGLTEDCDPFKDLGTQVSIRVGRYVGKTGVGGQLLHADEMISAGVLGATARLTIMAWDVDRGGSECGGGERDLVYFKSAETGQYELLGSLKGGNRSWAKTRFNVPINWVSFPRKGTDGSGPRGGMNEVFVWFDVNDECWCTHVGWASLEIRAISPVVLLHGFGQKSDFWTHPVVSFTKGLDDRYIPWSNAITHKAALARDSAGLIAGALPNVLKEFGVDSVHLVAHSKGGLDALWFLTDQYRERAIDHPAQPYDVLSLTTLDSPLEGTVLADIVTRRSEAPLLGTIMSGFPGSFWTQLGSVFGGLLFGNVSDLTTYTVADHMVRFIRNLPGETRLATVGADMDFNGNGKVDGDEARSLKDFIGIPRFVEYQIERRFGNVLDYAANLLYQNLRRVRRVQVVFHYNILGWKRVELVAVPVAAPRPNDVLVTLQSAQGSMDYRAQVDIQIPPYMHASGKTHANVAHRDVARAVADQVVIPQANSNGDMQPFRNWYP